VTEVAAHFGKDRGVMKEAGTLAAIFFGMFLFGLAAGMPIVAVPAFGLNHGNDRITKPRIGRALPRSIAFSEIKGPVQLGDGRRNNGVPTALARQRASR